MDLIRYGVVFVAALIAGAVNSVAGGGTVFSFSGLVWFGLPTVNANATNATALIPGSVGGAMALYGELKAQWRAFVALLVPTILGSLLGAFTVWQSAEAVFKTIVPFLVLLATLIFASRDAITQWVKQRQAAHASEQGVSRLGYAGGMALQFLISFYGGYFGAGIGILMLTSLSVMGMTNLHKMNALKNILAVAINGTAAIFFIQKGLVVWPVVVVAAVGALVGGYGLGRYARRIDQTALRKFVIVAGLVVTIYMFARLILG